MNVHQAKFSKPTVSNLTDVLPIAQYLHRIEAEPRSLTSAAVRKMIGGYPKDIAKIRFDIETGEVDAPDDFAPNEAEAVLIKEAIRQHSWPRPKLLYKVWSVPEELNGVDKEHIFEFKTKEGALIALQHVRPNEETGSKDYFFWTFFDDNKWRQTEPAERLPLWGLEHVGLSSVIFVHEGAKAARAMHRLINPQTQKEREELAAHPWGDELKSAAHVGWVGGAPNPWRTDWESLLALGLIHVYVSADHDDVGVAAVPKIAKALRGVRVLSLEYRSFPGSFDLGDRFPKKFFREVDGVKRYVGPSFQSCLNPATYATRVIGPKAGKTKPIEPTKSGKPRVAVVVPTKVKPTPVLRDEFAAMWTWVEQIDVFVCNALPHIVRSENTFDSMMLPFSDVPKTSSLLKKHYAGRIVNVAYRPDLDDFFINDGTSSAINLYQKPSIKPSNMSPEPFVRFLEYLIPDPVERHHLMRWVATLIARPDIRMFYAVLLVSESQGTGKTTLARILAALVGLENCSFPTERDIVESAFNGWVARKRLIVVAEIYQGHSFKAYNSLKSYISDEHVDVNEKYMRNYRIDNWAHVIASSNSRKALRLEGDDRRWYYPSVTETPWPKDKFVQFNLWLESGGLGAILQWAMDFGDYVQKEERPPMTTAKNDLIEESKSEPAKLLKAIAEGMADEAVAIADLWLKPFLRAEVKGTVFESDLQLRAIMKGEGWVQWPERLQIDGRKANVLLSPKGERERKEAFPVEAGNEEELKPQTKWVRSKLQRLVAKSDNDIPYRKEDM